MSVCTFFVPLQSGNKPNRLYIMAGKINYIAPVDTVSGMFGKRSHSLSGKAIISNVRRRPSQNNPEGLMYFSVLTKTTYRATPNVLAWNQSFAQVCAATRVRMTDPQYIQQDQLAFQNQTTFKTLYSYVWNVCRQIAGV